MPPVGFICPDKVRVAFSDCFTKCRLKDELPMGRCKALPFLRKCASFREWTGKPSTTQLLNGIRHAWLKIVKPYYVNPDEMVYIFLGNNAHAVLERYAQGEEMAEERIHDAINSGMFDFYDGTDQILYDYKSWGSYKVMQALGIKKIEFPLFDDEGNPVLFKSGPRKGQQKMQNETIYGDEATRVAAILDTAIQVSDYRDKLLTILPEGYGVKQMAVQVVSRDASTIVSKMRCIEEKAPLIPINGISPHWIKKYLTRKRDMLMLALESNTAPLCRRRERWFERRCAQYCEVVEHCEQMGDWHNDIYMLKVAGGLELQRAQEAQTAIA